MSAAIWARVSTEEQDPENQVRQLEAWAKLRGFEVVRTYQSQNSGWKGAHLKELSEVYQDARRGAFKVLLVWALDRLSREGPLPTLEIVHRLGQYGVQVLSMQEPWTETTGELRDLLLAIAGWVARMESHRRSERTKAGMQRARAEGKQIGRPKGSTDSKKRRRTGYLLRSARVQEGGISVAAQRFWEQVEKSADPDGCWLWTGTVLKKTGYGQIRVNGRKQAAHRFSYELRNGPIPAGQMVCHSCESNYKTGDITYRRCVRPEHLRADTQQGNSRDMVRSGRGAHGTRNPNAKLTEEIVREIRQRHASGISQAMLAQEYGLKSGTISEIVRGLRWSHVSA